MIHYILQTVFFQLAFLLVYELLLKKETFFTYNRWYLLLTPVISLILPLLKIESLGTLVPQESFVMLPEVYLNEDMSATGAATKTGSGASAGFQINWWLLTYASGFFVSFLLFLKKYRTLRDLFTNRVVSRARDFRIIEVPNSNLACTYFTTIFLGDQLCPQEKEQILSHELVHVREKHSYDLFLFEMLRIVFWFNPLIYIYQSRISIVHEFSADAGVVQKIEKRTYYQQLLNTAFGTQNISFINQFFDGSLIKKRIQMLQKGQSRNIAKSKYLVLLPLMLVMLTYVSCSFDNDDRTSESPITGEINAVASEPEDKVYVPFALIDQAPVYPGCGGQKTNQEKKDCLTKQVSQFVNKNFNLNILKEEGITETNTIYIQFGINKEGFIEIHSTRAAYDALEEEAKRVVGLLPRMTPGEQDGKKVTVIYSLPISFKVAE